jgi:hypothetical protein
VVVAGLANFQNCVNLMRQPAYAAQSINLVHPTQPMNQNSANNPLFDENSEKNPALSAYA